MAGQEDPVQREIHQDWVNRKYIEVITSSIKKIADFLNSFGQRASRGRRGWVEGHSGSLAMALRSFDGAFSGLVFASSFRSPPSPSRSDPQAPLGSACGVILRQAELIGFIAITPDPLTSPSFFQTLQIAPSTVFPSLFFFSSLSSSLPASFVTRFHSSSHFALNVRLSECSRSRVAACVSLLKFPHRFQDHFSAMPFSQPLPVSRVSCPESGRRRDQK